MKCLSSIMYTSETLRNRVRLGRSGDAQIAATEFDVRRRSAANTPSWSAV